VPEGTALALETARPAPGRRLHLRVQPAGLVPAQPLVLELALPGSLALPSGAALAYDRALLPLTRRADGRLELRLPALAGTAATASAADRKRALAARALAATPPAPCAGVPALDTTPDGGLADTAPIEADVYGQCMVGAVRALAQGGQFAEAVRLSASVGAYLQSIGASNTDGLSTRFLDEARTLACTAYGQALDAAEATPITRFGSLTTAVKPVLFWEATVQRLGAACPGIAPTRHVEAVEGLTTRALAFFAGRQGAVVDTTSVEYTEAVAQVRDTSATVGQVRSLGAAAPLQAVAQAQLVQRAQPAAVDAVLQAPWQRCRDSGQYDALIELVRATAGSSAVKTAAQYCGTQLAVQSLAADGTALDGTQGRPLGGVTASAQRSSGRMQIDSAGRLVLQGPIRALGCPAGIEATPEALELRLDGQLIQALPALTLPLADALRRAGIDAASFNGGALTVHRAGSPCSGFWGGAPAPLLSLTLERGRSVVLVFAPGSRESDRYVFKAEYRRLLEAVYGAGRVALGELADGVALLRSGRDVVLVSGASAPEALQWITEHALAVRPWLEAGGRLLVHELGLGPQDSAVASPFGMGVEMVGSGGYQYTFTLSWNDGRFSVAPVLYAGAPAADAPSLFLAATRVSGADLILVWDDDQADGFSDDPRIFPVSYDTVGQGTAVAGRRTVGQGQLVMATMTLPWAGYQGALDPLYTAVLRQLRAP
jgi:hypothetical protein